MYIDTHTIVYAGTVITGLSVIIGLLSSIFKWLQKQRQQDSDIASLKKENALICYALMACLDGLEQLGANHAVPLAKEKLNKHLNLEAHDQKAEGGE